MSFEDVPHKSTSFKSSLDNNHLCTGEERPRLVRSPVPGTCEFVSSMGFALILLSKHHCRFGSLIVHVDDISTAATGGRRGNGATEQGSMILVTVIFVNSLCIYLKRPSSSFYACALYTNAVGELKIHLHTCGEAAGLRLPE